MGEQWREYRFINRRITICCYSLLSCVCPYGFKLRSSAAKGLYGRFRSSHCFVVLVLCIISHYAMILGDTMRFAPKGESVLLFIATLRVRLLPLNCHLRAGFVKLERLPYSELLELVVMFSVLWMLLSNELIQLGLIY